MTARKKSYFAWALVALFFSAQMLVAHHEAAFGPEKHQHNGHPCDIQLFADHAKAPSLPLTPMISVPMVVAAATPATSTFVIIARSYRPALPRAPPISIV